MRTHSLSKQCLAIAGALLCLFLGGSQAADEAALVRCWQQLETIGKALQQYEHDEHRLPDQLSDLIPKYLPDRSILHCPADTSPGSPGRNYAHKDPKLPVSYSYEFSGDQSNGLPTPQGKFPKPDIGFAWGSFRQ